MLFIQNEASDLWIYHSDCSDLYKMVNYHSVALKSTHSAPAWFGIVFTDKMKKKKRKKDLTKTKQKYVYCFHNLSLDI